MGLCQLKFSSYTVFAVDGINQEYKYGDYRLI